MAKINNKKISAKQKQSILKQAQKLNEFKDMDPGLLFSKLTEVNWNLKALVKDPTIGDESKIVKNKKKKEVEVVVDDEEDVTPRLEPTGYDIGLKKIYIDKKKNLWYYDSSDPSYKTLSKNRIPPHERDKITYKGKVYKNELELYSTVKVDIDYIIKNETNINWYLLLQYFDPTVLDIKIFKKLRNNFKTLALNLVNYTYEFDRGLFLEMWESTAGLSIGEKRAASEKRAAARARAEKLQRVKRAEMNK